MVADLFHPGHVEFLRKAKELGDYLVVGLVTDEKASRYKRLPILTFDERREVIQSCRYVDEVMPHLEHVSDAFLDKHNFAFRVYAARDEAENTRHLNRFKNHLSPSRFKRVDYDPRISTTKIIKRVISGKIFYS
jgi:cytidyltransferase-like protein